MVLFSNKNRIKPNKNKIIIHEMKLQSKLRKKKKIHCNKNVTFESLKIILRPQNSLRMKFQTFYKWKTKLKFMVDFRIKSRIMANKDNSNNHSPKEKMK